MSTNNGFKIFSLEAQKETAWFLRSLEVDSGGFWECLTEIQSLPEHVQKDSEVETLREAFELFSTARGFYLQENHGELLLKAAHFTSGSKVGINISWPLRKILDWPTTLKERRDSYEEYEEYLRLKKKFEPES